MINKINPLVYKIKLDFKLIADSFSDFSFAKSVNKQIVF